MVLLRAVPHPGAAYKLTVEFAEARWSECPAAGRHDDDQHLVLLDVSENLTLLSWVSEVDAGHQVEILS